MFEETLIKGVNDSLAILGRADILKDAYLVGGTAAALQIGHRISVDLDFFTPKEFIPKDFSVALSKLGSFDEYQADEGTVSGISYYKDAYYEKHCLFRRCRIG